MYKYSDYIYNGLLLVNNIVRPHHKRLSQLMLYATTKCQSRCKHCSIWKKEETFLTLNDIKLIMSSKCITSSTTIGLEGGEFLLHPESDAIMEWFMPTQGQFWGIPLEKVIRKSAMTETLFSRNNFVPTIINNQIFTQGYYHEIELFVESVQKGSRFSPYTGFHSIYNTYLLIDEINKFINK